MIETLFTLKYGLVPMTLPLVRKDISRKSFVRDVKDWKVWLWKDLEGVEITVGLKG